MYKYNHEADIKAMMRKNQGEVDAAQSFLQDKLTDISELASKENGIAVPSSEEESKSEEPSAATPATMMENIEKEIKISKKCMNDPDSKALHQWLKYAETKVRETVKLIVDTQSETSLVAALKEVPIAIASGNAGQRMLIVYDVKQHGESKSRPQYRPPPLQKKHMRRMIGAILKVRGERKTILHHDTFLIMDACVHGNHNDIISSFLNEEGKVLTKKVRPIYMHYDEAGMSDRRERSKGALDVVEFMYHITQEAVVYKEAKHLHTKCSVRSNSLGPLAVPPLEDLWSLTFGQKKKLYGDMWVDPGGKFPPDDDDGDDVKEKRPNRKESTIEAVCFGAMSVEYYEDMIAWQNAKGFINLTSSDVNAAMAAINLKTPYAGIMHTPEGKDFFMAEMVKRTFDAMATEGSKIYEPDVAKLIGKKVAKKGHGAGAPGSSGQKPEGAKPETKKAEAKKAAAKKTAGVPPKKKPKTAPENDKTPKTKKSKKDILTELQGAQSDEDDDDDLDDEEPESEEAEDDDDEE